MTAEFPRVPGELYSEAILAAEGELHAALATAGSFSERASARRAYATACAAATETFYRDWQLEWDAYCDEHWGPVAPWARSRDLPAITPSEPPATSDRPRRQHPRRARRRASHPTS